MTSLWHGHEAADIDQYPRKIGSLSLVGDVALEIKGGALLGCGELGVEEDRLSGNPTSLVNLTVLIDFKLQYHEE